MRRRPADAPDVPLDIFDDERFSSALAGATQPAASTPAEPPPPYPASAIPGTATDKPATQPDAPRKYPKATTARRPGKGRATTPAAAVEIPRPPEPNVPLKFRVPQTLRSEFHRFKADLAATLGGVALDDSNLARPLVELFLLEQADRILEEATAFRGKLKRPPNGDAVGMAEFDHAIGDIFRRARQRRSPGSSSQNATS